MLFRSAPARELTWDELQEKYMDCAKQAPRISTATAAAVFKSLRVLNTLDDVRTVSRQLH